MMKKHPNIAETTQRLYSLFQEHEVALKGFQVNLVIDGAVFDGLFREEAVGTILKHHMVQEEINGAHCTLLVTRAIEPEDLNIDSASTAET